jgi:dimethylaniline monooxygenase (N-oxide forming)
MSRLIFLAVGDQTRFGVPKPKHPMWREHATLSQELLPYVGHGWIKIKPNIESFSGKDVRFSDGSCERFDAIIYATGYRPTMPFLSPDIFSVKDNEPVDLYRQIASPVHPGLFFAGLVQPIGPTIPLVEVQARWIASVLADEIEMPQVDKMRAEIKSHHEKKRRAWLDSARYTLEVDAKAYAAELTSDIAANVLRAKSGARRIGYFF